MPKKAKGKIDKVLQQKKEQEARAKEKIRRMRISASQKGTTKKRKPENKGKPRKVREIDLSKAQNTTGNTKQDFRFYTQVKERRRKTKKSRAQKQAEMMQGTGIGDLAQLRNAQRVNSELLGYNTQSGNPIAQRRAGGGRYNQAGGVGGFSGVSERYAVRGGEDAGLRAGDQAQMSRFVYQGGNLQSTAPATTTPAERMALAGDQLDYDVARQDNRRQNVFTARELQYGGRRVRLGGSRNAPATIEDDASSTGWETTSSVSVDETPDLINLREPTPAPAPAPIPAPAPAPGNPFSGLRWDRDPNRRASQPRPPQPARPPPVSTQAPSSAPVGKPQKSAQIRRSAPPKRSPGFKDTNDNLEDITITGLVPIREEEELESSSKFKDPRLELLRSRRAKPTPLRPGATSVGSLSDFSGSSGLSDFTDDTQSDFVFSSSDGSSAFDTISRASTRRSDEPGKDPRLQLIRRSARNRRTRRPETPSTIDTDIFREGSSFDSISGASSRLSSRSGDYRPSGALSLRTESSRASTPSELRYSDDFDSLSSQSFNTISTLGESDISVGSSRASIPSTDFSEFSEIRTPGSSPSLQSASTSPGSSFVSVRPEDAVVPVSELPSAPRTPSPDFVSPSVLPDAPTGDASRVIAVSPDFEDDEIQGLTGLLPDVPDYDLGDDIYTAPAVAPPGGLGELVEYRPGSSPSLHSASTTPSSSSGSSRASDFQTTFIPIQDVRYSSSSGRSSAVSGTTSPGFYTPVPEASFSPVQQTTPPPERFDSDDPEMPGTSREDLPKPKKGTRGDFKVAQPEPETPEGFPVGEKIVGSTRRAIVPAGAEGMGDFEKGQRFFRQRGRRATTGNQIVKPTPMRFTDMGQEEAETGDRFTIPMRSAQFQGHSERGAFRQTRERVQPASAPAPASETPEQLISPATAEAIRRRRLEQGEGSGFAQRGQADVGGQYIGTQPGFQPEREGAGATNQQRRYGGGAGREIPQGSVQFKAQLIDTQESNKSLKREMKSILPTLKLNIFNQFSEAGIQNIQMQMEEIIQRNQDRLTSNQIGRLMSALEQVLQNNMRIRDLQNKIRGPRGKK